MPEGDLEETLDASDLLCPLPVLKAGKALRSMARGQILKVIATDPMSAIDVPHFCTEQGYELLESTKRGKEYIFRIRQR